MGNSSSKSPKTERSSPRPRSRNNTRRVRSQKRNPKYSDNTETVEEKEESKQETLEDIDELIMAEAARRSLEPAQQLISWDENIIGQKRAKQTIEQLFFFPRRFPSFIKSNNSKKKKKRRCVLFWGPPGTGKTLLARSLAKAHKAKLIDCKPSKILDKYVGVSEKKIEDIFNKAKIQKSIILIDELDSFGRSRTDGERNHVRTLKTQLLQSIDSFEQNLMADSVCIACTNFFDQLDFALRRRFTDHVFCDLPDENDRFLLLKHFIKEESASITEEELQKVAHETRLYSGSDIERLVTTASNMRMRDIFEAHFFIKNQQDKYLPCEENTFQSVKKDLKDLEQDSLAPQRQIIYQDFLRALKECKASITPLQYEKYRKAAVTDTHEQNKDAKKTVFQLECEKIFDPKTDEEKMMGSFSVYRQLQRYITLASNPESKTFQSSQNLLITLCFSFALLYSILPLILFFLLSLMGIFELTVNVMMPLGYIGYCSLYNSKDTSLLMKNQSLHTIASFCQLVVIIASGNSKYVRYFDGKLSILNMVIEWYFMTNLLKLASHIFNFAALGCKSGNFGGIKAQNVNLMVQKYLPWKNKQKYKPRRLRLKKKKKQTKMSLLHSDYENLENDSDTLVLY